MTSDGAAALAAARGQVRATGQPMLIASHRLWEGYAAVHAGELALGAESGRAALSSNALGGLSRIALAELVVGLSSAYQLLDRPSAQTYLHRAERAQRGNDPLCADIYLYLGSLERSTRTRPSADGYSMGGPRYTPSAGRWRAAPRAFWPPTHRLRSAT